MYLHITTGTLNYLEDLQEKYPQTSLNAKGTDAVLFYEDNQVESVFATKKTYEVLYQEGELNGESPITIFYIPSAGDGFQALRMHLSDLTDQLQEMNGILSYRLAVNDKSETYVLFIKWADLLVHDDFKYTDAFKKYLTHDALKRFRNEESLFGDYLSSKTYYSVDDNEFTEEEKEEFSD